MQKTWNQRQKRDAPTKEFSTATKPSIKTRRQRSGEKKRAGARPSSGCYSALNRSPCIDSTKSVPFSCLRIRVESGSAALYLSGYEFSHVQLLLVENAPP